MKTHQKTLPINPAANGYPRTAKGEYGVWQDGSHFAPWQSEWHKLDGRYCSIHAQFGIVELEDGTWLSGLAVWDERHQSREEALRAAGEEVIQSATRLAKPWTNGGFTHSARISLAEANAIITWASGVIGCEPHLVARTDEPKKPPHWADLPLFMTGTLA
ncbi:hypothetical protein [Zavarzinella formosa]|uniref:hypothetical protein n=1 Tax=Zavarzinella formosa TaxID=360055 RepID=UPI000374CE86|nr:hypothetical protein [Zavarzinella formosa]